MPSAASQGMLVTSIVPLYEVCNTPGSNPTSCSTAFETITTPSCSKVLTGWFTSITISDCDQSITPSTQSGYSPATTIISAPSHSSPTLTTYMQSISSYYIAPWHSLAANDPSDITVRVCKTDLAGQEICSGIKEVWALHTEFLPVTRKSTLSISSSFI